MNLPDGTWVLGLGDSSPEIRKIKTYLRKKFASYAGNLADTDLYDQQLVDAVKEMQRRYGLPMSGFIGYSLKVKMGYLKPDPKLLPQLHTVCGTGVPWSVGPDADCARYLQDTLRICNWRPCGYEAKPFPMWGSILGGVNQLITDISESKPGTDIWGIGYSQGAIVWSLLWMHHIVPEDGILHHRKGDVKKVVMFENPAREQGSAAGNLRIGEPIPEGAGILEERMVNTPPFWIEFAHGANGPFGRDLYADNPPGQGWGENTRAICKIIMGNNWWAGKDSILAQLFEIGVSPLSEGWAAFQAIMKAGMFFGSGTGPHVQNLPVGPAIDYLRAV